MDKYKFGNRLYELRKANNITQEKLGKMLGVSNKAISKWENGESYPRLPMLDKIAECFNMSVEELLEYNEKVEISKPRESIKTDITDKINKIPRISISFLMGLGWIRIDEKEFLYSMKNEYGLSNKELSQILCVSERTIGLWENGIKKPSALASLRIAALYYNNCNGTEGINTYSDVSQHFRSDISIIFHMLIFSFIFSYFCLYPSFVAGESIITLDVFDEMAAFNLREIFSFLLPSTIIIVTCLLSLKYVKLNRPDISDIIKSLDKIRLGVFVYLLCACIVFHIPVLYTVIFCIYFLSVLILEKIYSPKVFSRARNLVFLIISITFLVLCMLVSFKSMDAIDLIDKYNFNEKYSEFANSSLYISIIEFAMLSALKIEYDDIFKFANQLTVFFPREEIKTIAVSKNDIIKSVFIVLLVLIYGIIVEINRIHYVGVLIGVFDLFE